MMNGHNSLLVSQLVGAVLAGAFWGLSFWRIVRTRSGNEALECGGIAVAVVLALGFSSSVVSLPEWTLFSLLALLFLLCNVTLFFFFKEGFQTLKRPKANRGKPEANPKASKNLRLRAGK